ncbi:MAG TPA: hypothetical protein ACFYD4_03040 [Candidatus Wunengus sp. YC61]|uniref:hypothetical protein n=1 Tax=Candidatus Wunengus sp. YC61 TaxID=3367698 RepID=UPI004025E9E9
MKPICHLGASIITGATVFLTTKTITPSIACFLVGWLVDVDHIWDFYKNVGKDFNVKKFVNACENGEIKKAYLYFHSYELLFGLIFLCFFTHFNYLVSFTTLGFAVHLFFDQMFNPVKPLTYFITYRILNSYNKDNLFKINPKKLSS